MIIAKKNPTLAISYALILFKLTISQCFRAMQQVIYEPSHGHFRLPLKVPFQCAS